MDGVDNYYEILGIPNTADSAQIKAAFKRLAKIYHPDWNPGKPLAEEQFKLINEAYHTLNDPLKKLRYDSRVTLLPLYSARDYEHELRRRRYWYWKKKEENSYRFDKEYFRIQGLAFLVFIGISGFCFGLVHTADYIMERKHLARWNANSQSLKEVKSLFGDGEFNNALFLIKKLETKDPYEFRFMYTRDSLTTELHQLAEEEVKKKNFAGAISYYMTLQDYEQPVSYQTLRNVSICQYYLGNFKESVQALKHLHNQRPRDLELVYQIGMVNLEKLENPQEALHYFTLGKKLFKQNLSQVYGSAFEVILDPSDVPDIYFDIFEGRARANMILQNFEDAVTDCNWAVFLRPMRGSPFLFRAQAYAQLNRRDKVCHDLYQAEMKGLPGQDYLKKKFCR